MRTHIKRFNGICIFVVFTIMTLYSSTVFSAVPEIINYQGSLSDNGGNPINATVNITFTLYDDAVAGSSLWQETQAVTVTSGQFSVQFGADGGNPLNPMIFENPAFLGVQVDADAEMAPRQALTAVGYAFRSKTVESDTLNSLNCAANEIPKFIAGEWACAADDSGAGDITGVTTSNGITGGGTSGDVNVSADTNFLQRRVNSFCPAGQSIRAISATGTITCEVDNDSGGDITGVNAGIGLTGGGTLGTVTINGDTRVLQARVDNSCPVGQSIRVINQNGTVVCEVDTDTVRPPTSLSVEPVRTLSHFGGGAFNTLSLDIGGMSNRFCSLSEVMVENTDTSGEFAGCDVIINPNGRWLLRAKLQDRTKDANVTCSATCFLLQN